MVKVFSVVGDNFHNVKAYCNHNKAENCVKEMLKADKKGKIAVGFIEEAVESKHLKDNQVQALVNETLKQINENKKGKISEKSISKAKKLKKRYNSKITKLTKVKNKKNGKDEKEPKQISNGQGSGSSTSANVKKKTLESRIKALPKDLSDKIGLFLIHDIVRDAKGDLNHNKQMITLKPWILRVGPQVKSLDLSGVLLTPEHLKEIVAAFPKLVVFKNNLHECEIAIFQGDKSQIRKKFDAIDAYRFQDAHLKSLSQLKQLKVLELKPASDKAFAKVTNKGFEHVGKLTNLTHLILGDCSKVNDDGVQYLNNLKKLRVVVFGSWMTGLGLQALVKTAKKINHLDLSYSENIKGEALQHLLSLTELEYLNLFDCRVDDAGMPFLAQHPLLKTLNLTWTEVTDVGLQHLQKSQTLTSLEFEDCDEDVTNAGIAHIGKIAKLETFIYSNEENPLNDEGFEALSSCSELRTLKVQDFKHVTEETFKSLKKLQKLTHLELTDGKIKKDLVKKGLKHLSELPNLQTLVLDSKIDDACLKVLSKFPALISLSLEECEKVTDDGLKDISSSSTLQELKMAGISRIVTKTGLRVLNKFRSLSVRLNYRP